MGIEGLHSLFSPSFEPLTDCSFDFLPMPLQCPFVASLVLSTSRRVCAVLLANRLFLVLPSSYLLTLYLLLPRSVDGDRPSALIPCSLVSGFHATAPDHFVLPAATV